MLARVNAVQTRLPQYISSWI